ncbi:hypothetical protein MOSE0_G00386 [Monosporozyma servazzii]
MGVRYQHSGFQLSNNLWTTRINILQRNIDNIQQSRRNHETIKLQRKCPYKKDVNSDQNQDKEVRNKKPKLSS